MRRLHLWFGLLAVAAFLLTGQFMHHHQPPVATMADSIRLLYRSRHIYILASGLVNLMLGLYLQPRPAGWRLKAQIIGSALLTVSPLLLIWAFGAEPARGLQPEMWRSHAGLYALFGGCMLHLASGIGQR
jgi:hypothetical protein